MDEFDFLAFSGRSELHPGVYLKSISMVISEIHSPILLGMVEFKGNSACELTMKSNINSDEIRMNKFNKSLNIEMKQWNRVLCSSSVCRFLLEHNKRFSYNFARQMGKHLQQLEVNNIENMDMHRIRQLI